MKSGIEHLTGDEIEDVRTKCEQRAEPEKVGKDTVEETRRGRSGTSNPW
ncbi:MAG: hypothetical protein JWQ24_719 [Tardiphaga sp.]|nr:hypothetical protein [Tardiphaga sp.]